MLPTPAQYLLRFDDLCPTMSVTCWQPYESLIQELNLRPILAIVPDNRDPTLNLSPPDPEFWSRMRALQSAGATIALHGYRHLCFSRGKSLVPMHRHSEFAGVPSEMQRQWIHAGLDILRRNGLSPRMWIAPRHGFDRNTLHALRDEGVDLLSDGLARVPFARGGVTWIPQQLWSPLKKSQGVWTICIHTNTARKADLQQLRAFSLVHAGQFTSVDRLVANFPPRPLHASERLYEVWATSRMKASRAFKRLALRQFR